MHIDIRKRTLSLSVGEFANFSTSPNPPSKSIYAKWRTHLGQVWHDELRKQIEKGSIPAQFERPISGEIQHKGWKFILNGRVDQLLEHKDGTLIREIKTVSYSLPLSNEDLIKKHPTYFLQLTAYQILYSLSAEKPRNHIPAGELLFVEASSGSSQAVPNVEAIEETFYQQVEIILEYVEQRRQGLERLRQLTFSPAFASPREGQEEIHQHLAQATNAKYIFFDAPTGYGKTGCVLQYALNQLRSGKITRIIYLTGKSTGQLQVTTQLQEMLGTPAGATWWQIRNKREHCINSAFQCFTHTCSYLDQIQTRWSESGLQRFHLFSEQPKDIESLKEAGRQEHICPYEITRSALPFIDIWIADYNYLFAPKNKAFLSDLVGFDPSQTLLLIDEAHNLPSRVASGYSFTLSDQDFHEAMIDLQRCNAPQKLLRNWEELILFVSTSKKTEAIGPLQEAELEDHLSHLAQEIETTSIDHSQLQPETSDTLFQLLEMEKFLSEKKLSMLIWGPSDGVLQITCLDAGTIIKQTLEPFPQTVFISATLNPLDHFKQRCGLQGISNEESIHLEASTPWRNNAYTVACDLRVDTRYKKRSQHTYTTASTIASLCNSSDKPIAAFFPSYHYSRQVAKIIDSDFPFIRVANQPKTSDLKEQQSFIEEALLLNDVLFLILGSSFAESIDILGGQLSASIIIGPALPEVNAIQEARMQSHQAKTRSEAFREVYQIPGLQKINQALGRLVRAPGQRTQVLLHCQRFADPSYHSLLAPEYQTASHITNDSEFSQWLADPSSLLT
ncbi:MAG: PD-(D/E)XK nuclease family protein [Opitutaceae bacterium]|nr:PD-(D/E)XK nuclease family protein [Opitutaceae bacterium]